METGHIASQIKNPKLAGNNTLHVIGVIQNTVRYHSRYRLFRNWVKEMLQTPNVELHVVEAVYKDRAPECAPQNGEYNYTQVSVDSEIWLKENLVNIGVKQSLPGDWKYMAWVDCDVTFRDPDWAQGAMHQLQHYNIIQPWSDAVDLDFFGSIDGHWKSFGSLCAKQKPMWHGKGHNGYDYAHTGYAWCCNRYFYENVLVVGGLIPWCIVGAGDHHMAWGCIGKINSTIHQGVVQGYFDACSDWQSKAQYACGGLVGFLPGRIEHHFHGPKTRRGYWSRWNIIIDNKFNPKTDMAFDSQGVIYLSGSNAKAIEQQVMMYNRSRNEDSIESY